ncbi:fermentation-respiration switch protein FrsA (DUF1100 family) [Desulfofundulus luciae]|uniref:Fermentation-respiration switch protein FrsA (DUF1100 family) n=1 Tax=Desulfofundulus luciae TaxID=74702 RepID=A0ABU0B3M7_9FIRM|nr:alpha/beta fold hydrolase [Desulfofundulus luciae]MDQ0287325.1 fermentation-respiration switch protein FrsA (DUF1100 family) [Desulfofundulus luciae]
MNGQKVYFFSEGMKLEGILYGGNEGSKRPGVVVCHGFGGVKETTSVEVCQYLVGKGYMTLCFDYRGFGGSEGTRGRLVPMEQVQDIRNAITFLQQQPGVDPEKIGLYGASFGGANVIYAAAIDQRVKCTVATVPVGHGEHWLRSLRRNWEWEDFLKEVYEHRVQKVLTGKSKYVDRLYVMLPDPDTQEFFKSAPKVEITLDSVEHILEYKPEEVVDKIAPRPLQIIYAEKDVLIRPEQTVRMYDRAREPKRLCVVKGAKHFDVYNLYFEQTMAFAYEWFKQWLPPEINCYS